MRDAGVLDSALARRNATDQALYPAYLALAEGMLDEAEFAAWLRAQLRAAPSGSAQAPRAVIGKKRQRADSGAAGRPADYEWC